MENANREQTMGDLLKDFDVKRIHSGDILDGVVIDVNDKEVMVNIDYAFDGVIAREDLTNTDQNPLEVVNKGDQIKVYVLSPHDGEGYVKLSRKKALEITEREDIKRAFKNEENVKVYIKEEVKGGLVAYYGNIRVFIPASLASRERIELSSLIGKELEVKIIELDFRNRKVVASRRVIEDKTWKKIWVGLTVRKNSIREEKPRVDNIDLGGITGLITLTLNGEEQKSWRQRAGDM